MVGHLARIGLGNSDFNLLNDVKAIDDLAQSDIIRQSVN